MGNDGPIKAQRTYAESCALLPPARTEGISRANVQSESIERANVQSERIERANAQPPPADFLNHRLLQDVVARFTYRPDVEIRVALPNLQQAMTPAKLLLVVDTEDSRNPGKRIKVVHQTWIPQWVNTEDMAKAFIRQCIAVMVAHEMDEWLRFDGQLLRDPHEHDGQF